MLLREKWPCAAVWPDFLLLAAAQEFCVGPLIGKFFVFAIILGDLVRSGKVAGSDGEIAAFEKQCPGGAGAELGERMGVKHRIGEIRRFLCQIQGADKRIPCHWEQHGNRLTEHSGRIMGIEGVVIPVGDKAAPAEPGAYGNQFIDHNSVVPFQLTAMDKTPRSWRGVFVGLLLIFQQIANLCQ